VTNKIPFDFGGEKEKNGNPIPTPLGRDRARPHFSEPLITMPSIFHNVISDAKYRATFNTSTCVNLQITYNNSYH